MRGREEDQLLTPQQAARYLNVSLRTLQDWRKKGTAPPSIKFPSEARRYRKSDLDAWILEHQEED
jgi:excisionase family DNA binding protein